MGQMTIPHTLQCTTATPPPTTIAWLETNALHVLSFYKTHCTATVTRLAHDHNTGYFTQGTCTTSLTITSIHRLQMLSCLCILDERKSVKLDVTALCVSDEMCIKQFGLTLQKIVKK